MITLFRFDAVIFLRDFRRHGLVSAEFRCLRAVRDGLQTLYAVFWAENMAFGSKICNDRSLRHTQITIAKAVFNPKNAN